MGPRQTQAWTPTAQTWDGLKSVPCGAGTGVRSCRGHHGSEGHQCCIPPSRLPTLCSSRSFFYPKTEGKAKKPEEEAPSSVRETEPPPKYVPGRVWRVRTFICQDSGLRVLSTAFSLIMFHKRACRHRPD